MRALEPVGTAQIVPGIEAAIADYRAEHDRQVVAAFDLGVRLRRRIPSLHDFEGAPYLEALEAMRVHSKRSIDAFTAALTGDPVSVADFKEYLTSIENHGRGPFEPGQLDSVAAPDHGATPAPKHVIPPSPAPSPAADPPAAGTPNRPTPAP